MNWQQNLRPVRLEVRDSKIRLEVCVWNVALDGCEGDASNPGGTGAVLEACDARASSGVGLEACSGGPTSVSGAIGAHANTGVHIMSCLQATHNSSLNIS